MAKIVDGTLVIDNAVLEADAITGANLANVTVIYE